MHITTAGRGNPPIVFVHGFACDSSDWQAQFELLESRNALIACDLPGHGRTPGGAGDCSIEEFGAEVAELLVQRDLPPVVLVGHSMGCRVVLQCYLTAPDRVAGIVLLDGSYIGSGDRSLAERGMSEQLATQGYEGFVRDFFAQMFLDDSDPNLKAETVDRALALPAGTGAVLLTNLVGWDAEQLATALGSVRVPLMVIQCTTLSPERVRVSLSAGQTSPWLELVLDQVPDARVEIVLDNGHFPHLEAPDEISSLISDFVSGLPPSP